jgi:3D (Asp-Asp-Asp) domain-containing protein
VKATGYSLVSDELGSDGDPQTATGTYPTAGRTIAVDPHVIPYGSRVKIPALGNATYIAEDTGGMIKGNHIDIYMANGDQARVWGNRMITIYVQPQ